MEKQDYYSLLSVPRNASQADIKKAYRRLASKLHPDKPENHGKDEKVIRAQFQEAKEAYEVLTDPARRAVYDQFGRAVFDDGGKLKRGGGSGNGRQDSGGGRGSGKQDSGGSGWRDSGGGRGRSGSNYRRDYEDPSEEAEANFRKERQRTADRAREDARRAREEIQADVRRHKESIRQVFAEYPRAILLGAVVSIGAGVQTFFSARNNDPNRVEDDNDKSVRIRKNIAALGLVAVGGVMAFHALNIPDKQGRKWAQKIFTGATNNRSI